VLVFLYDPTLLPNRLHSIIETFYSVNVHGVVMTNSTGKTNFWWTKLVKQSPDAMSSTGHYHDLKTIFSKLSQYDSKGLMEWECCIKNQEDEKRRCWIYKNNIIKVTDKAFWLCKLIVVRRLIEKFRIVKFKIKNKMKIKYY
jgi:hypothetical protein